MNVSKAGAGRASGIAKFARNPANGLFATALLMFASSAGAQIESVSSESQQSLPEATSSGTASPAEGVAAAAVSAESESPTEAPPTNGVHQDLNTIPVASEAVETAPVPEARGGGRVGIEEVIVTAQKREENIQDVPISIQAFSAAELDAKGITDPSKLVTVTPGLIYDSVAGFAVIYIRGVGTDAFIPSADLSVATYVDGVYFPFAYNLARSFGTVERVEVLKGPQGTLFGRNSTGGAISIVTKDPAQATEGSAGISYGNFDDFQSRAYFSTPITDKLAVSLAAVYNHKEDYYKPSGESPEAGDAFQDYQDKGANLKIRFTPLENFDAILSGYYYTGRGVGTSLSSNIDPSQVLGQTALGLHAERNDYESSANASSGAYSTLYTGSLTLKLGTSALDIKSISAYQDFTGNSIFDFDGTSKDLVSFGTKYGENSPYGKNITAKVFTQELQFISNADSWGADWLNYVGGVYYINSTAGFDPVEFYVGGLENVLSGGALSLLGSSPLITQVTSLLSRANAPQLGTLILLSGLLDTESTSVYAQGTAKITDKISVTLGGRFQDEKRRVYKADLGVALDPPNGQALPGLVQYPDDSLHETNFSPKAVLQYQLTEGAMTYASFTQGFKSGSFNIINLTKPPTRIKSEKVTSYEIGVKSDLFDHRLRLNGAIFRNEIENLQVQFLSLLSGGVVQFENAPKAHIDGAELGGTMALTQNLILGFAATYLDSRYDDYPNAEGFDPQTGTLQQNNNYTGNSIARAPKFTGSVDLNYFIEAPGGSVELGGSYYYNNGYFFTAQNTIDQPSYDQVGAQVSYLYERYNLRLTAFGDNLLNDEHYLYKFATDFGTLGKLAPPRTYGVRVAWTF